MKTVLAFLLFAGCCYGQPFSVGDPAFEAQQSSSSSFTLRSLPGLLLLVDYRTAATNNTQVSTITDQIGGLVFSQASTTIQPTGTFNGLRFNGAIAGALTNLAGVNVPTNFTFFAYFSVNSSWSSAGNYAGIFVTAIPIGFYMQQTTRAADFYFGGDHPASANNYPVNDIWCLWVWANGSSYTNGTLWGTTAIPSSYPVNLKSIGGAGGHNFGGVIKYIGVTTNTMSLADIARVWTYVQAN